MIARASLVLLASVALASPPASAQAPEPTLAAVLRRAGEYVEQFHRQLSGIVAEETYVQEVVPTPLPNWGRSPRPQRRRLRSDLLLLRPDHYLTWVQFRDVLEVDGRPVRDRGDRLTALFLDRGMPDAERVRRIREENARYNIGPIARTMNLPALPLAVLAFSSQRRFTFAVDDAGSREPIAIRGDMRASPTFTVTSEVWRVRFEEREGPTLVHTSDGENIFSHGRLWIEPATGRVLMGEIITANDRVRGELVVSFQSEPLLGFLVPIELRERYTQKSYPGAITGAATYGNFRRFQVDVQENLEVPAPQR